MIKVHNLEYSYPKANQPVIKGLDFEVKKGEIFGFLGPSGAGKSTTQKILYGLLKGFSGHVAVAGEQLPNIQRNFYEHIGVAFEFPNLYNKLTAIENLRLYQSFYKQKVSDPLQLLSMVNLDKDKNTRVEAFSKGMKMRLNFIRSLLNKPQILFLDEPTSGLDPVNARQIKDIILNLKTQGTTVFLTTHNMSDAEELCDQLAFMNQGLLPVINSPAALKIKHGKKRVKVNFLKNGIPASSEFALETIGENNDFIQLIQKHEVTKIHSQEATLEDVFLKVTGNKLI
jgi:fluoroquinolone transport system ATP-binding protein